ncbi:MAG: Zn-dependent hydrolase [Desulfobacterales bacterium]
MISDDILKQCFDNNRMASLIDRFAQIGRDQSGGVTRLAFSNEDRIGRDEFIKILNNEFKLKVRIDSLGNIFARREGMLNNWPVIMTGSHLDSVRNGGKYDGPAGVFSSLEVFRALDLLNIETYHPLELCVLSSEEPNTFGISTFGSRGMTGTLKKEHVEHLRDDHGQEFTTALKNIGGDINRIHEAVRKQSEIKYFIELHIEQMPFLSAENKDIGIVEGVTGIYRESITVTGIASHCGTTPMDRRQDALCAASEIILEVENAALEESGEAVATVGHMKIFPNSINITPGKIILDMEVRSYYAKRIQTIIQKVENRIEQIKKLRHIDIKRQETYNTKPIQFSSTVTEAIGEAAESLGFKTRKVVSMAGHDAAHLSRITKAGMIFIPCKDGISHCPEEFTETESIVKGAQCLLKTILLLDRKKGGASS